MLKEYTNVQQKNPTDYVPPASLLLETPSIPPCIPLKAKLIQKYVLSIDSKVDSVQGPAAGGEVPHRLTCS